jgi:hypothetical protein
MADRLAGTVLAEGDGPGGAMLGAAARNVDWNLLRYLWRFQERHANRRGLTRRLAVWLDRTEGRCTGQSGEGSNGQPRPGPAAGSALALEALAWCHALAQVAAVCDAPLHARLADRLRDLAHWFAPARHDARAMAHADPSGALAWQLWSAELPLAVRHVVAGACEAIQAARALEALQWGLERYAEPPDEDVPAWLRLLPALVACWTRCALVAEAARIELGAQARGRYALAVLRLLQWSRSSRQMMFCVEPHAGPVDWLKLAASLAGEEAWGAWQAWCGVDDLSARARGVGQTGPAAIPAANAACDPAQGAVSEARDPTSAAALCGGASHTPAATAGAVAREPAYCRPEPCLALMRQWRAEAPRFALVCQDDAVHVELEAAGRVWLHGPWQTRLWLGPEELAPPRSWQQVGWEATEEACYLELEGAASSELLWQRYIVLSRKDDFVLMADALLGTNAADICCEMSLPLAGGVGWQPAAETHEGVLAAANSRLRILPLGLPEWRNDPRPGSLFTKENALVLRQQARHARRVLLPLWIDLSPRRSQRPCTWRQLTVAQDLAAVPPDVACAYRAQIGREQWLVYRTLAPAASRTVLGHHLVTEMLVGRFTRRGLVEAILEIE